jgi:hypothetical protein
MSPARACPLYGRAGAVGSCPIVENWVLVSPETPDRTGFTAGRRFSIVQIKTPMGNLLYLIAVILIIAWAIGYFAYDAGGIIHILLVIAIIAILLKVIRREGI